MTPSQIILAVKACALLVLLGLAYYLGGAGARADFADYRTKIAEQTAKVADLATKAERIARQTERAHVAALDKVAAQYEKDKADNDRKQSDLVASLRAGNVRLHQRWQAAVATAELSGASKSASELDAEARDREQSAARIVRAAAECDAQVKGLQAILTQERK